MRFILFVLAITICQSFFKLQVNNRCKLHKLNSLGSDVLPRPEDEDSPEFKEYLRQLLRMQANRAQSGYAAPSSGKYHKQNRVDKYLSLFHFDY